MQWKWFVVSLLLTPFLFSDRVLAADVCTTEKNIFVADGSCWNTLAAFAKSNVIRGIWVGMQVRSKTLDMADSSSSIFLRQDFSDIPAQTTIGDFVTYFDELYSSPANRSIHWSNAYILAAMKARDDDENDRLNLIRFLREYGDLPTSGELVGADGPEQVKVSVNGKVLTIRLAGIDVSGEPATTKALIPKFIAGLTKVGYGGCSEPSNTPVVISYHDEIFDAQNRLTAYVSLFNFGYVCSATKPIPLNDLAGHDGPRLPLNGFLIKRGLAKALPSSDAKWSETKKNARNWSTNGTGLSSYEKEGYYRFGGKKDPLVELISNGG